MKKKNELGLLIRNQREMFRLTQRELALKLGVKASHVAYIEGGLRRPSLAVSAAPMRRAGRGGRPRVFLASGRGG